MNLIETAREVEGRYRRYLETTFYFKDPDLRQSFRESLEMGQLSKGPFLEATPSFRKGMTTEGLFEELLTEPPHAALLSGVPREMPLYVHQEQAIRKAHAEGRNVVIATGTASGKTETFLYPILLHLYNEFRNGQLGNGVRALVLYPMNALANDQRDRLGEICRRLQEAGSAFSPTFGQYIGETPRDENDSQRHARDHLDHRLPGELVLRKEMWESPPHILLTNYSMLEYLLIRPDDSPLFDDGRAQWWTFLVLDEAHQYRGSKGIEMGMLIRRLKNRLREGGRTGPFRCIATSATIASDEHDKNAVARFATELFDEEFREQDIVLGAVDPPQNLSTGTLRQEDYQLLRRALDSGDTNSLQKVVRQLSLNHQTFPDASEEIGYILQHDHRSTRLHQLITASPMGIGELTELVFLDHEKATRETALSELVDLLIRVKNPSTGARLLTARYHLFLRSLEGAFISYQPHERVFLERRSGTGGVTFEIALCRECGQHYLVGRIRNGMLHEAIRDPGHPSFGATFLRPVDETASALVEEVLADPTRMLRLCTVCGAISLENTGHSNLTCDHEESILVEQHDPTDERPDQIPQCSNCGYRAPDPVREVVHGTDGPHAVIATTLYQTLPEDRRKVLAFADGRQEAAFFAWYLEDSYKDILNRNLMLVTAESLQQSARDGLSLSEMAIGLRDVYRERVVLPPSAGDLELQREAWIRLYREFLTDEPRISLEGVGLLRWHIRWPDGFQVPKILFEWPWQLTEAESKDLVAIMLDFARADRAFEVRTVKSVPLTWSDLNLQATQNRLRIGPPRRQKGARNWPVRSWDGQMGRRSQFLVKLLMRKGLPKDQAAEHASNLLREIWEALKRADESITSQYRLLLPVDDERRLNPDWWRVFPVLDSDSLYQCDTCTRLQYINVNGVCHRHGCQGNLMRIERRHLEPNHYRQMYETELPGVLRVEEHTAQIDSEKAREFQRDFKEGRIHVLSSSTTFELGVDLGNLDTIFLRNVPPEVFNYAQRVGRAGRRGDFPGFAVTFCRRNPHDLYHFAEPVDRILKGIVHPPVLALTNEKIISRHIMAVALSRFFRAFPKRFEDVEKMFTDLESPSGSSDFLRFIREHRNSLEGSLRMVIPNVAASQVGLDDGSWIDRIAGSEGRLAKAESVIADDFNRVRTLETQSAARRDYGTAGWASRRAEAIRKENTLSFLSRKAIIPKYGFPVDVVELDSHRVQQTSESGEILLQRDLSIAIAEFAPTSKLVANKREWTSYGIKKVAERELPRRHYRKCSQHNLFESWKLGQSALGPRCCASATEGQYIIPEFGFVTNREPPKEPRSRSIRVFSTRPYFVGLGVPRSNSTDYGVLQITRASTEKMVVLCEGRKGGSFYICQSCGAGFREPKSKHLTPYGSDCSGALEQVALGHEFDTDIVRIQFTLSHNETAYDPVSFAYSLAFALVEGCADTLDIPSTDLNTVVTYAPDSSIPPIVLYDNVPGGAGLVARLAEKDILGECLNAALARVNGSCGCGENDSCYGCLRSYRNQFAHDFLRRGPVKHYLQAIVDQWA